MLKRSPVQQYAMIIVLRNRSSTGSSCFQNATGVCDFFAIVRSLPQNDSSPAKSPITEHSMPFSPWSSEYHGVDQCGEQR